MENIKGKIKFYDQEQIVFLPFDFKTFNQKLGEALSISPDLFQLLRLSYSDNNGRNNLLKTEYDYMNFLNICKCNNSYLFTIQVEISEQEDNNQNNNINVNNPQNANNQAYVNQNNNINVNTPLNAHNQEFVNQNNNINVYANNQTYIHQNSNMNDNSSFSNPFDDNSYNHSNSNIKSSLNDMIRSDTNLSMVMGQGNSAIYPETCYVCQENPLTNIFYYCPNCSQILCFECEKKVGMIHDHAYFKIQNMKQYNSTNLVTKKKINHLIEKTGEKIGKAGNKVSKVFGNVKDMISTRIKNNNPSKIKEIRKHYDLSAVTDEQIKKALDDNNGNVDAAIASLFSGK